MVWNGVDDGRVINPDCEWLFLIFSASVCTANQDRITIFGAVVYSEARANLVPRDGEYRIVAVRGRQAVNPRFLQIGIWICGFQCAHFCARWLAVLNCAWRERNISRRAGRSAHNPWASHNKGNLKCVRPIYQNALCAINRKRNEVTRCLSFQGDLDQFPSTVPHGRVAVCALLCDTKQDFSCAVCNFVETIGRLK